MLLILIWRIWQTRNDMAHGKETAPVLSTVDYLDTYYESIVLAGRFTTEEILKGKMPSLASVEIDCSILPIAAPWPAPATGFLVLSVDGSFLKEDGTAATSMIIRNEKGELLLAAYRYLFHCNDPLEAELHAIMMGMALAIQHFASPVKACDIGSKYTKVESEKNQLQLDFEVKNNDFDALKKTFEDKDKVLAELKERSEADEKKLMDVGKLESENEKLKKERLEWEKKLDQMAKRGNAMEKFVKDFLIKMLATLVVVETSISFKDLQAELRNTYPWSDADAVELNYFSNDEQRFLPLTCDDHMPLLFAGIVGCRFGKLQIDVLQPRAERVKGKGVQTSYVCANSQHPGTPCRSTPSKASSSWSHNMPAANCGSDTAAAPRVPSAVGVEEDAEPDEAVPTNDDEDEMMFPELVDVASQQAVDDEYMEEPISQARFDDTDDEEKVENMDSLIEDEYDGDDMPTIEWNREKPELSVVDASFGEEERWTSANAEENAATMEIEDAVENATAMEIEDAVENAATMEIEDAMENAAANEAEDFETMAFDCFEAIREEEEGVIIPIVPLKITEPIDDRQMVVKCSASGTTPSAPPRGKHQVKPKIKRNKSLKEKSISTRETRSQTVKPAANTRSKSKI
ncbi:Alpha-amylase [Hordeum vulgare]|nr:Alpha-amylase [Hordeum vulgare]